MGNLKLSKQDICLKLSRDNMIRRDTTNAASDDFELKNKFREKRDERKNTKRKIGQLTNQLIENKRKLRFKISLQIKHWR